MPAPGDDAAARDRPAAFSTPLDILCVIPSLRAGGAERVLCGLVGGLVGRGHAITILTLMPPGEPAFFPLPGTVERRDVGGLDSETSSLGLRGLMHGARQVRALARRRRLDLILGFTTLGSMMALLARLDTPVIVAERTDPARHAQRIGRLKTMARDRLYARAEHVVVQTMRARNGLTAIDAGRITTIANPVAPMSQRATPATAGADGRYLILGVGRLDWQKGFGHLIEAFAPLAGEFPLWDVAIYGDGPERAALQAMIERHGLARRVALAGVSRDIESVLVSGHILAFPSGNEGFPNALAEALAAGLPAIGHAGVSGVEDLIVDRQTGLLSDLRAPVESLRDRLRALMSDPALRVRLGEAARRHVAALSPDVHLERWEDLLQGVVRRYSERRRR